MHIVVASSNIFRRELSGYVLSEAGHQVSEAKDVAALLALLGAASPDIVVADVVLAHGDTGALQRQIGELCAAPILWLAHVIGGAPSPGGAEWLGWPYHPQELLLRVARITAVPQGTAA